MAWEAEAISMSPDKCKTLTTECHCRRTEDECGSSDGLCLQAPSTWSLQQSPTGLEQRFSAFLMLWPFNNRSSCCGDPPTP